MEGTDLGFIHTYVPAQHGEQRVLLVLHGTGGDETSLLPLGQELAPDAALLSPRGKVLERGAPRFFRRLAEGVLDLATFVERAAGVYGFDPHRLIVAGYSNGANMAASLLLTHPELFGAAILFRAMMPFEPEALPDLHGKAVYLAAGRRDPLVDPQSVTRLSTLFQAAGAQVVLRWQEGRHSLAPEEIAEARAWLDTVAKVGSRPEESFAVRSKE